MMLSSLYLHVVTQKDPIISMDLKGVISGRPNTDIEVSLTDWRDDLDDEVSTVKQIPCYWVEAYLGPFLEELVSSEGVYLINTLLGTKCNERFVTLVEESIRVRNGKEFSSSYKDSMAPLSEGFLYWLEYQYLPLMKEDDRNAEIRAVGA